MNATMADRANELAAEELARKYWEEARKWKRIAQELGNEIARRDADAEIYTEVYKGIVIFREDWRGH